MDVLILMRGVSANVSSRRGCFRGRASFFFAGWRAGEPSGAAEGACSQILELLAWGVEDDACGCSGAG